MRCDFAPVAACGIVGFALSLGPSARADIPVGYKGLPFNPAVAGGPKCPPTVKAGPYPIPGRLDFVNYDLGGDGVAYHTGDHLIKGGAGYRSDTPTATLSLTSVCIPNVGTAPCTNVWYDTSPLLDGTPYPSPTTADFSIGAVQVGDWFNITVNVATTGTYEVSSTWATGNGPPGGEGGNGYMGLTVFSNNVMLASWSATFPNFNMYADFHHWKAYPNFATVSLTAGLQVIKLQSLAKHLQLDYVQFSLVTGDGGLDNGDASSGQLQLDAAVSSSGSATASGATTGTSGTATDAGISVGPSSGTLTAGSGSIAGGSSGAAAASGGMSSSGSLGPGSATGSTATGGSGAPAGGSSGTTVGNASGSAPASGGGGNANSGSNPGCSLTTAPSGAAPRHAPPLREWLLTVVAAGLLARRRSRLKRAA